MIPPGSGKEPRRMTMGFPGGAEQRAGLGGPGAVAVFGALAAVDMDLEARTIHVGDLQAEGCMEPEAQARDGGAGDLVVPGGGGPLASLSRTTTAGPLNAVVPAASSSDAARSAASRSARLRRTSAR